MKILTKAAGALIGSVVHSAPVDAFARCHERIISRISTFSTLPALMEAAVRSRMVAADVLVTFENEVLAHHGDEESELFPAVLRWAAKGEERDRVAALVQKLTAEHRSIENLWREQRPAVEAAVRGKPAELNNAAVSRIVMAYSVHAAFEEQHYLPLAQEILARDNAHLASLGMSLHVRHAPQIPGYI